MLNITGEKVKLWVNEREGKNGKFETYAISFSKKTHDGYIHKSIKFFIDKDVHRPAHIDNGVFISFEGFPTLDVYTDRNGNEVKEAAIFATNVVFDQDYSSGASQAVEEDVDGFVQQEIEIPF